MAANPDPARILAVTAPSTTLLFLIAAALLVPASGAVAQSASRDRDRQSRPPATDWAQLPSARESEPPSRRQSPLSRESASDAVRRVERDTRGEVLSVEPVQYDGRNMHRVKVIDDRGRVRVFVREPTRGSGQSQDRDDDD